MLRCICKGMVIEKKEGCWLGLQTTQKVLFVTKTLKVICKLETKDSIFLSANAFVHLRTVKNSGW